MRQAPSASSSTVHSPASTTNGESPSAHPRCSPTAHTCSPLLSLSWAVGMRLHVSAVPRSALPWAGVTQRLFLMNLLSLSLTQSVYHWHYQPACEDDPKPWPPSQLQVGVVHPWGSSLWGCRGQKPPLAPGRFCGHILWLGTLIRNEPPGLSLPSQKNLIFPSLRQMQGGDARRTSRVLGSRVACVETQP